MLERLIHDFLKELGEDPEREGLERTPARVAKFAMRSNASMYSGRQSGYPL